MGQNKMKQALPTIVSVLIGMIVLLFACFCSYRVGYEVGRNSINLEDWQIEVYMENEKAQVYTDYGLIWVYEFDEGYFGE